MRVVFGHQCPVHCWAIQLNPRLLGVLGVNVCVPVMLKTPRDAAKTGKNAWEHAGKFDIIVVIYMPEQG